LKVKRNRVLKIGLYLVFLFVSSTGWAQFPKAGVDRQAYQTLLGDILMEVDQVDFAFADVTDREAFKEVFQQRVMGQQATTVATDEQTAMHGIWPPKPIETLARTATQNVLELVTTSQKDFSDHAIADVATYTRQRLGSAAVNLFQKRAAVPIVIGGEETDIKSLFPIQTDSISRIPSFYEAWGIKKFLLNGHEFTDSKPRVVYVVPPSSEYLRHYSSLLASLEIGAPEVYMSRTSRNLYRKRLRNSALNIARSFKMTVDHVAMGYYSIWEQALSAGTSVWKLIGKTPEHTGDLGLSGRILTLQNKETSQKVNLFLIRSDMTVWGESSAFIAEGLVALKPRSLTFLGSAGGLSPKVTVYDISLPEKFMTTFGKMRIPNFLSQEDFKAHPIKNVTAKNTLLHGNTYSPIEQDRAYMLNQTKMGVETIDVEQSLVAEVVQKYNDLPAPDIAFGAVNIVTDLPYQILSVRNVHHDLDRVDQTQKGQARLAAVTTTLNGIAKLETERSCEDLLARTGS
jgi:hypothetical protein